MNKIDWYHESGLKTRLLLSDWIENEIDNIHVSSDWIEMKNTKFDYIECNFLLLNNH